MPISGAWFASTPIDPVVVRDESISTSSANTCPSGVRTSTWNLFRATISRQSPVASRQESGSSPGDWRLESGDSRTLLLVGALLGAGALLLAATLLAAAGSLAGRPRLLALGLLALLPFRLAAPGCPYNVIDRALEQEGAFRDVVVLALDDLLEGAHGLLYWNVGAGRARELLGDEERLREEALDLARPLNGELVLVR